MKPLSFLKGISTIAAVLLVVIFTPITDSEVKSYLIFLGLMQVVIHFKEPKCVRPLRQSSAFDCFFGKTFLFYAHSSNFRLFLIQQRVSSDA